MNETTRILVVEDNPADADFIRELLPATGRAGFPTEAVARLAEAVTRLQGGGIDLILLDLGLPDSQGLATLQRLHSAAANVPVVVLTGTDDDELGAVAMQAGAQDYLVKGQINRNLLMRTIRYARERHKLASGLRTSEADLRAMAESMPQIVWACAPDGQNTYFNQQWVDYTGLTHEESHGPGWIKPFHPDDQPRAWAAWKNAVENNGDYSLECRLRRADGTYRWWLIRGVPQRDETGKILKWFGTCTDIEALKQAEAVRRESEEKFRRLFNDAADGVCVHDAAGRIEDANQTLCDQLGYTREELRQLSVTDIELDLKPAELARIWEQIRLGKTITVEGRHRRRDGTTFPAEIHISQFVAGDRPLFYASGRDITERKQAEEKMRAALVEAERFRAAMDQVHACVYLKDVESRYIYANQPTQKLFGISAEALVGSGDTQFFPRETVKRLREIDARVFRGEQTSEEVEVRDEQGRRRVYWEVKTPIYADAERQQVSGLLGISTDITERKQMEEALEHSQHLLAESEAMGKVGGWEIDIKTQQLTWTETVFLIHELDNAVQPTVAQAINFYTPASRPIIQRAVSSAIESGETFDVELEIITAKGNLRSVHAIGHADLARSKVFGFFQDITDRKRAEKTLATLALRHETLLQTGSDGVHVLNEQGNVVEANAAFATMLGYTHAEALQLNVADWDAQWTRAELVAMINQLMTHPDVFETRHRRKDGRVLTVEISVNGVVLDGRNYLYCAARDITARKQAETYGLMGREILRILNEPGDLPTCIGRVVATMKARSGLDAVGIRLPVGEDFPYFVQEGFPEDFLRTENTLVQRQPEGDVCRDQDGKACLECTCGLVLAGGTDPANPLFTPGGSCWTNDSTTILHIPPNLDPRRRPRNRCIHDGYNSVMLVPIRSQDQILGLIQFNDRRKDCFTLKLVELMEEFAQQIGLALRRKSAETALRKSEELFSLFMRHSPIYTYIKEVSATESRVLEASDNFMEMIGISGRDMMGKTMADLFPPEFAAKIIADDWAVVTKGEVLKLEEHLHGHHYSTIKFPVVQGERTLLGGYTIDITERVQAENALRASEEQLRFVTNLAPVLLAQCDHEQRYRFVNQSYASLFGLQPADLVGRPVKEMMGEAAYAQARPHMDAVLAGQPNEFSMALPASGELRVLHASYAPEFNASGRVIGFIAAIVDETQRKLAEDKLRVSEAENQALISAIPDLIFTNRRDGEYLAVHATNPDMLLLPPESFLHRRVDEVLPPLIANQFTKAFAAALDLNTVQEVNYMLPVGGQESHFEARVVPHTENTVITIVRNVTARVQAENALRASEAERDHERNLLRTVIDHIPDMIYVRDLANRFLIANQAFARRMGVTTAAGLIGKTDADFYPAEVAAQYSATDRKIFDGDALLDFECTIAFPNGETLNVLNTKVPLKNANGTVIGLVGVSHDITARKLAELAFGESEERYHHLFELESDAIVLVDCETHRYVDFNQSAQRLYGYSREELLQMSPVDVSTEPEKTRAAIGSGNFNIPLRWHRKKNGEFFAAELTGNQIIYRGRRTDLTTIRDVTARQQVLVKLQDTTRQLVEAQRIASLGSYVFNVPTGTWTSSEVLDHVFGLAEPGVTRELAVWLQLIHPQDRAEMQRYLAEEVLTGQTPFDRTYRIIRVNDQSERWVHGLGKVTFDESGQAEEMVGVIQDITAQKQAEQEIQRQATFAHFNPNPVLELSATGTIKYFNAAALEMTNRLGQTHPAQILPPQTVAIVRDCLTKAKSSLRLETRHGQRTISWSFFPVPQLQVVHCYAGDITERKRVEESHARLALAVEQAAETIVITDTKGTILYVNPAFERTTGYTRAEALGQNPRVLKSGQHDAEYYQRMWAVLQQGEIWSGHLINRRKDGTLYEEEATISPIRDPGGTIVNFVAVKRDVTREVQLESQFRQTQKMESIGTLAGGIAHDFNNILAAMFGYSYLLQQDTEGNAPAQESIAEILTAANRAKELVQQILTFSRQREQKREVIRLDVVVKEATKFLRASLPAQIKIELKLAADTPAVLADPTQIYQVTMNLATNALHALEGRSGLISVRLAAFQPDVEFIQAHPELRPIAYARLTVADTGQGMSAKTLERIFEPFFTTKPIGQGTGLGLAVVHGIVQSHAGAITVESEVGQGTTFNLYFPAQTTADAGSEPALGLVATGQGQHILLLDDEPKLTAAFQRLLERLRYRVTSSNNPREAIAWFQENPAAFDLVITDLTMPEINGLEVARTLHALRPEVPILLLSGHAPELNREKLRAAGIGELLEKPVALPALADALQRALVKT